MRPYAPGSSVTLRFTRSLCFLVLDAVVAAASAGFSADSAALSDDSAALSVDSVVAW